MTARVLVVDDHPLIVDGLRAALATDPALDVVGAAGSLASARAAIEALRPDVVLLDLRLPDGSGTELLAESQRDRDAPAFIVLSTFLTTQYTNAAIALGASGFLLKTAPAEEIRAAIATVVGGGIAFSGDQLRESRRAGWTPLTAREHELVAAVMAARSNDEIARQLGVSTKTVEGLLSRLYERFAVQTRTELAVLAEREHWLDLPVVRTGRARQTRS